MKRLIAIALFCGSIFFNYADARNLMLVTGKPPASGGEIAYVNGSQASGSSGSDYLDAPAINATAGNTIIVAISEYDSASLSGVTDTASNTYVKCGSTEGGDASHKMNIYVATNITGNSTNVVRATFSSSDSNYKNLLVAQYSGLAGSSVYDVSAAVKLDGSDTTTHTSNSTATTSQADELIFAFYATWNTGASLSTSAPYTIRQRTSNDGCVVVDRIVSSTGSYSATITSDSANLLVSIVRTFKKA